MHRSGVLLPNLRRHVRPFHSSRRCALPEEHPRVNQLGIQYLSNNLHKKVFPTNPPDAYLHPSHPSYLEMSQEHLKHHQLLGKKTNITTPVDIPNMPTMAGSSTLDEHFTRLGLKSAQPYLDMAECYLHNNTRLPPKPNKWVFRSGWTRYAPNQPPQPVPHPLENEITFDVEVMYKKTHYACLCTAASSKAWYGWVSPMLTEHVKNPKYEDWDHLIPFDTFKNDKLLIGFNVSYDRARVLEEYHVKPSRAFFLDAMALHIAVSGICSQQRPTWQNFKKHKLASETPSTDSESALAPDEVEEGGSSPADLAQKLMDDPWLNKGAPNSLANVAEFHCNIKLDKSQRDVFASEDIMEVINGFQDAMTYCAGDVEATYEVAKQIFPIFRRKVPHPVSFAALKQLGKLFLPTTQKWPQYIQNAESVYEKNQAKVASILEGLVEDAVRFIKEDNEKLRPDIENDPWLKQLNWTIKQQRLCKDGTPYSKQAYLTGFPEWYRDLHKTVVKDDGSKARELNVTVRTRITPLLLKLKWEGHPLVWTTTAGWCFKVPYDEEYMAKLAAKNYVKARLTDEEFNELLPDLRDNGVFELFKVPHPDGPNKRCTSVMTKDFIKFFDSKIMTSEFDYAKEIMNLNSTASYWVGNRARIQDQFCVFADPTGKKNKFFDTKLDIKKHENMGLILPKLCTMGTITRRATENTWLTASNSKPNRIGSELKSLVEAPKGYVFVGADVDSEELWIASLIGDSMFKIHGGTALGWMCLEGDKSEKTDLHSKTASIMGILRNDAKVFNYGRIYGAGVKFATRLLKQCNSNLSDDEAAAIATKLYEQTKGCAKQVKSINKRVYHGGTESVMFNALEAIAHLKEPKTPVLGAAITDALNESNLNKNNYLTSRVNWTIQSSGVDYLHLLIVSMEYLINNYNVDARLMITVHDEVRFMVKEEHALKCALLLQISNLWTRALFCEQMGIKDLPQSCAFFSEVDVDHVLRKEVNMDCITPSNPKPIPPGKSYDISALLDAIKPQEVLAKPKPHKRSLQSFKFKPRQPVIEELDQSFSEEVKEAQLRLQNSDDDDEWKCNLILLRQLLRNPKKQVKTKAEPKKTTKKRVNNSDISKAGNESLLKEIQGQKENKSRPKIKVDAFSRRPTHVSSGSAYTDNGRTEYGRIHKVKAEGKRAAHSKATALGYEWGPKQDPFPKKAIKLEKNSSGMLQKKKFTFVQRRGLHVCSDYLRTMFAYPSTIILEDNNFERPTDKVKLPVETILRRAKTRRR